MSTVNAIDMTSFNKSASTTVSAAAETQDRFLKLLVTQMKNQDPLNPMDNAQVTTQIAQLNTVSGIDRLNATLSGLAAGFAAAQSVEAAGLIGHGVLVAGSGVTLQDGAAVFGAELPQSVDSLKVSIVDGAGRVVHSVEVGAHAAGNVLLNWDGIADDGTTAADGSYRLVLDASAAGGAVTATPLRFGQVEGVSAGAGGAVLNLGGGLTAALGDVKQIM